MPITPATAGTSMGGNGSKAKPKAALAANAEKAATFPLRLVARRSRQQAMWAFQNQVLHYASL